MQQDTECNAAKTFFWWRLNLKAEKLKKTLLGMDLKDQAFKFLKYIIFTKLLKMRLKLKSSCVLFISPMKELVKI